MKTFRLCAALVALLTLHATPAVAASGDYTTEQLSGDVVTGGLILGAFGTAFFKDDHEGERQFLRSTGAGLLVNNVLRLSFNGTSWGKRPNHNDYAFPSGHAGVVVSAAQFLQERYGWKYGVPAYAAAAYVSWVRVDTHHHHWRDIAAGGLVGFGVSALFVTPIGAVHMAPVIGPDWLGMRWERSF
jgi:hypothetical protein